MQLQHPSRDEASEKQKRANSVNDVVSVHDKDPLFKMMKISKKK